MKQSVTQDSTKREHIQCLYVRTHTKRSDMDHTVLSANYTMPAFWFASVSPDGATSNWDGRHLARTYYSFIDPEGMRGWVNWPGWLTYSGWFAHISGYPSATGRVQDKEVRWPKTDVIPLFHSTNATVPILWDR